MLLFMTLSILAFDFYPVAALTIVMLALLNDGGWALIVWAYALAWFLLNDRVKLTAYRIFDVQQPGLLSTA